MPETETSAINEPILSLYADEHDMLELVEFFVGVLPERIAAIEKALATGGLEELESLAHQLKGTAGRYGFPSISDAAAEIESAVKGVGNLVGLEQCVAELSALSRRAQTGKPQPADSRT